MIAAIAVFAGFLPSAYAQGPTITSSIFGKVGDKQVSYAADTSGITPGSAGANQTWDFTNLKPNTNGDSIVTNLVAPSSTPYAADFPSATIAANSVSGQSIVFMDISAGKSEMLGFVTSAQGQTIKNKYSNSLIQYTTPMSINYTHNDIFAGQYEVNGITIYSRGTVNVNADAYGTVLMPGGKTYNNVLRAHSFQRNIDSMDVGFSSVIITTETESYTFVQDGRKEPIITITNISQAAPSGTTYSKMVTFNNKSAAVSGITEESSIPVKSFKIYPNPSASRTINVVTANENTGFTNINVINQLGQLVKSFNNLTGNNNTIILDELPKGIYQLQFQTNTGVSVQKLILE